MYDNKIFFQCCVMVYAIKYSSPDSYTKHVPSEQEALCSEAQVFSSRTAVLPKNIKSSIQYVKISQTGHKCILCWNSQVKEGNYIKN